MRKIDVDVAFAGSELIEVFMMNEHSHKVGKRHSRTFSLVLKYEEALGQS